MHTLCNSEHLSLNYQEVLDKFSSSWYKLQEEEKNIHDTKNTFNFHNLEDYFNETDLTWLKTTDELLEWMHQRV
jgi:hypothetical protein